MSALPAILQDVVDALTECGPRAKVADLRGRLLFTTTDVGTVRDRLHELRQLDRVVVEHHNGESYWSLLGQMVKGNTNTPPAPKRKYERRTTDQTEPGSINVRQQPGIDEDEKEREKRERKEQREREWADTRARADRAEELEVQMRKALLDKLPAFDNRWDPSVQAAWFASFQKLMGPQ
ncbi:MAG: hypothetical protein KAX77_03580 [Xanthomonadales bacterium]|nr:hypothetical protein [Xanthomonadales bacterium]